MKGKYFWGLVLITMVTFSFVWVRLQIVRISYEINTISQTEKNLRDECNKLTLQINEAKSLNRLEKLAVQKFKMRAPHSDQLITLSE